MICSQLDFYSVCDCSDYVSPSGVLNFFLCFSTEELVAIAQYLGYDDRELDPIFQHHAGSKERQVGMHVSCMHMHVACRVCSILST